MSNVGFSSHLIETNGKLINHNLRLVSCVLTPAQHLVCFCSSAHSVSRCTVNFWQMIITGSKSAFKNKNVKQMHMNLKK